MRLRPKRGLSTQTNEPWTDVATARLFLAHLTGLETAESIDWEDYAHRFGNISQLSDWLITEGIGPLAYIHFQKAWPELATRLRIDTFTTIAQNSLHFKRLEQVSQALQEENIQFVLLKGVALAHLSYPGPMLRTMSDVDIWVHPNDMSQACHSIKALNFKTRSSKTRPPKLQQLSQGEIQFYDKHNGLIELHWAPMSGWLLKSTAAIDNETIWKRTEITPKGRVLTAEDTIIQLAVHVAVNHRFRLMAVRSFLDIALTSATRPVDWNIVIKRAQQWRVSVVLWLVLYLAQALVGISDAQTALSQLQPSWIRRYLLHKFISPESILAQDDLLGDPMQNNPIGYLFLLLLIDHPMDILRLIWQAIWPDQEWLVARYDTPTNHWQHLWYIVKHGRI